MELQPESFASNSKRDVHLESFTEDVQRVYKILAESDAEIQSLYQLLDQEGQCTSEPWNKKSFDKNRLATFLTEVGLPNTKESRLGFLSRLINLRQESLQQCWKKLGFTEDQIEFYQEVTYKIIRDFYQYRHEAMIQKILDQKLLTPFYQTVLAGWSRIGKALSLWQTDWTAQILNQTNKQLTKQFNEDEGVVNAFLETEGLKDKGHEGKPADRCYSVLLKNKKGQWESNSYAKAFPDHIRRVCQEIQQMIQSLEPLSDDVYREKSAWIGYLNALSVAFQEVEPNQCVARWADVDRQWMKISGRIQPGHPLEYYEDHYRKAVALEWDIRISNPEHYTEGIRRRKIQKFAKDFFQVSQFDKNSAYPVILDFCVKKLESVQLHIGSVFSYYGADLLGLPSAQVVPNDEVVSKESGKKIFAFPDAVSQSRRNRPFLRFSREVFGQEFLTRQRNILFNDVDLWFRIYDVSTIGHEYGHILWIDQDTEPRMDHCGNFKNVEEWKATTGGLMGFFQEEEASWDMKRAVTEDLLSRAVGLLSWKETTEVLPYYIESHIHLVGLFESSILDWDEKNRQLKIEVTPERFERLKSWYFNVYSDLVTNYYLPKNDPTPFLKKYVVREKHYFNAAVPKIYDFQKFFWDMYVNYGQEIDSVDKPSNYHK